MTTASGSPGTVHTGGPVGTVGTVRIGVGAGAADDRISPAVDLVEHGDLDYLVCECLAERTIARETLTRRRDASRGYTPMLEERIRALMPLCRERDVRLVTNMGAANPRGAGHAIRREAAEAGVLGVSCAVVLGDDVSDIVRQNPGLPLVDGGAPLESILPAMASANAYLGADVVRDALRTGAEVVVTGRVADPSLFVGAAMYAHDWSYDDLPMMAAGTIAGHLLECSTQVTGGYFADPGKKDVERLAELPFPYADVTADGQVTIGKVAGSGGRLDRMTCIEQATYEMHDPSSYMTPDCVLDITRLDFREESSDRVRVLSPVARERTESYKVVVGYFDGFIGVGEISYAGVNALARARLAADVAKERFRRAGGTAQEVQVDLIGISSLLGQPDGVTRADPYEVRLRIAARCPDRHSADMLGYEVTRLGLAGPCAAGGPVNVGAKEVIAVNAVLLPRTLVQPRVVYLDGDT